MTAIFVRLLGITAFIGQVVSWHSTAKGAVKLTEEKDHIHVEIDGIPFTDYWFGPRGDRPFTRPFFLPVLAADGTPVTSDQYPMPHAEHPHHQSMWVAHQSVNEVDHWSLNGKPRPARQEHVKFDEVKDDHFVEELTWEGKEPGKPLLHETRTMRFLSYPNGSRAVDWTVALTPVGERVTLADKKDAGLCSVRVATEISRTETITNSKGDTGEKACWGKPADWCDVSGKVNDHIYGIAIFDSPKNPRHPTTWHVRQYGLMTANPFGYHDFNSKLPRDAGDLSIEPGSTDTFTYRVIVHQGDATAAKLSEKYKQYAGQ